jgi:hypothetical protein
VKPYLLALTLGLLASLGPGRASAGTPLFSEKAAASGLDFVHFNGMSGELYLAEIMGAGAALFDYDNDGDLDVYLVQGGMLGPGKTLADAVFPPPPGRVLRDRLFRNDLVAGETGERKPRFTDVTEASGIRAEGYGMGVATGDFDNDGFTDLYITNFGVNQLLRNNGDGTFSDATEEARAGDPGWSVGAAFLDYDRDGWQDLYVGNYVRLDLARQKHCYATSSALDYCTPLVYEPYPDRLYHNRGDGSFEDVSDSAGITQAFGAALGVVAADVNGDGWPDIYVANDASPNQLWINQRNGTFRDDAMMAGAAVNVEGAAEGSMGVDAADYDADGDVDLFMTHLTGETNTLYVNDGQGWFEDRTIVMGLAGPSKSYTGFGTGWYDFDNDGWLDIFVANGAAAIKALSNTSDPFPLRQTNQLFMNEGGRRFREVTPEAGAVFRLAEVSRGAAFGDVDNDGDTDVLVTNNSGPVRLLLNQTGSGASWLGLRMVDAKHRDALGTRVELRPASDAPIWRRVHTDGSYVSASDPRVVIGLGTRRASPIVLVHWPDGQVEKWRNLPLKRYSTLRQGEGEQPGNREKGSHD